jgi:hypothetical protein
MIQIGRTSVWFTDGFVRCESYTGNVHGNMAVKQKLISISEVAANKFEFHTNKGKGYIQFNDSSNGNYTVELVLQKFIGSHRFYGGASSGQVESTITQLKSL